MAFRKIERTGGRMGFLAPGTVVRFASYARKLGGKTGVIDRFKRTKYSVIVDGQNWTVPPSIITEYDPDADGLSQLQEAKQVPDALPEGSANWDADDPVIGDIVIFYRGAGSYDIAKVHHFSPTGKPHCKMINGRSRGKVYGFQKAWYVCKLPSERFRD